MSSDNITSSNKRIAGNTLFLSIRMIIVLLVGLYTTRAVLSLLGVEDYGVYNVVCGFVSMFAFLNNSMVNGAQRFYNYEYGRNGELGAGAVFNASVIIQFILAIIILFLAESFGLWYLHNKMVIPMPRMEAAEWVFQFSVISFVFIVLQVPFAAAIMAHERMDYYALVQILDAFLKLAIVFIAPLFHKDNLIIYGALWSLISLFDFFMYAIYSKIRFPEVKINFKYRKPLLKSMVGFSGWNLMGSLSGVMREQGINLVMNLFFGPLVNAARGVAAQVNGGLQGFAANVMMPVRPQVVQSYAKGDLERCFSLTYSVSKLSVFVLYIVGLPVILEINYILDIWLETEIPEHTANFIIIIFLTTLVSMLNAAVSNVVHASGKMAAYQSIGGIIGISSVPIAYFLTKIGGSPEVAMIVSFATAFFGHFVGLFILKKIVSYSIIEYLRLVILPIIKVVIISICFPLALSLLLNDGFSRFVIVGITSTASSLLSIWLLGLNQTEKKLVIDLLFHRMHKQK